MEQNSQKRIVLLVVLILIIAGAIFYLESQKAAPEKGPTVGSDIAVEDIVKKEEQASKENGSEENSVPTATEARIALKREKYPVAKEISTPDGFINVDNINITDLIGKKVILVDFWTYSCINCQRTLPYLTSWDEKYRDDGLVIIGIHTPEFEFEKDYNNVLRATQKWGIKYPVVLDNDFSTWRAYENRYWPRKYLIDIDGFIVYDHIGEGGYDETEAEIVKLLNEKNEVLGMGAVDMDTSKPKNVDEVDFAQVGSPETYLGNKRLIRSDHVISMVNPLPQDCIGTPCDYTMTDTSILNRFSLSGRWIMGEENVTLVGDTGSIFYRFNASKVNLVAASVKGTQAEIYLDGKLISNQNAGSDVKDGKVLFKDSDLYNLVDLNGNYEEHLLEIRFLEPGVEGFAFTFG